MLREMIVFAIERLMELEVGALIGTPYRGRALKALVAHDECSLACRSAEHEYRRLGGRDVLDRPASCDACPQRPAASS
jgi:hypothetical protein